MILNAKKDAAKENKGPELSKERKRKGREDHMVIDLVDLGERKGSNACSIITAEADSKPHRKT